MVDFQAVDFVSEPRGVIIRDVLSFECDWLGALESYATHSGALAAGSKIPELELSAVEAMSEIEVFECIKHALENMFRRISELETALRDDSVIRSLLAEAEAHRPLRDAVFEAAIADLTRSIEAAKKNRRVPFRFRRVAEINRNLLLRGPLEERAIQEIWRKARHDGLAADKQAEQARMGQIDTLRLEGYSLSQIAAAVDRAPSAVREFSANRGIKISKSERKVLIAAWVTPAKAAEIRRVAAEMGKGVMDLAGLIVGAFDLTSAGGQRLAEDAAKVPPRPRTARRRLPAEATALARSRSPKS